MRLVRLRPPGCVRCGRPLARAVPGCVDCPPPGPVWARAPFLYEGPARTALMCLKFGGTASFAEAFGPSMAQALDRAPSDGHRAATDGSRGPVVSWVPLGRARKRARGFDQAEALARALARCSGLPVRRLLDRTVETSPQARKPGEHRRIAVEGAFEAVASAPGATVVLVDDVLTSGATAAECARVLLTAGATEVGVLTAARSLGVPLPARCYDPNVLLPGSVVARERFSR